MAFTFFFRDWDTLESALDIALPRLSGRAFIHVWDAGCAHGPEPYTLAILLRERMSDYLFRNVRIHATDVDSGFASQVTSGVFGAKEVQRIPAAILRKYFRPSASPGFVQVIPELRAKVSFMRHDLLSLQPIRDGFSVIVCKNVLLHFQEAQRCDVLRMFHQALQPDGILVVESTQKLPESVRHLFHPAAVQAAVYQKVQPTRIEHGSGTFGPVGAARQRHGNADRRHILAQP
ncbi:MAG: hypothetical protein NUV77_08665 [Thermoguttaceae bacterium]|nr:hypothetical protein [Thermoguttaceae bacterium]